MPTTVRKINEILIHCTATPEGRDVHVADIEQWHRQRQFRPYGGTYCGYHYLVCLDGSIEAGKPLEAMGQHCKGHNKYSVGICYAGGLDTKKKPKDTRTKAQKESLFRLVKELKARFPNATVHGHNEFAAKDCPCFNVSKEYSSFATKLTF